MRVAMLRAAHESSAPDDLPAGMRGDNLFASQTILRGNNRTLSETLADQSYRVLHLSRFCCNDAEFAIGELIRLCCSFERHMKFVLSRDAQTVAVESSGVIFAADKSPYLRNPRQMRRVQAANGATSDDANTLHAKVVTLPTETRARAPAPHVPYRLSTFTNFSAWLISFATIARNRRSALLNESSIMMPLANSAS